MANVEAFNTDLTEEQLNQAFSRALGDYTDEQIDSMIAQKQDTLTIDSEPTSGSDNPVTSGGVYTAIDGKIGFREIYGQGTAIPENADLNDYGTTDNLPVGQYYSENSARTATLHHRPFSGSGFRMMVTSLSGTNKQQWVYPVSSGTAASCVYIRSRTTSGWASWYKLEGVATPDISPTT
jgi:hypothetical protein